MNKKNVLKKNYQFQEIINKKKQKVSKYLIFYYRKNDKELRVGISVSKKFANAVVRNLYKRQIRNIMDELNFWKMPFDVIIIIRKQYMKLSFKEKKNEIKKMFGRI